MSDTKAKCPCCDQEAGTWSTGVKYCAKVGCEEDRFFHDDGTFTGKSYGKHTTDVIHHRRPDVPDKPDVRCPCCNQPALDKVGDEYSCYRGNCEEDRYFRADGTYTGGSYGKGTSAVKYHKRLTATEVMARRESISEQWNALDKIHNQNLRRINEHWNELAKVILRSVPPARKWLSLKEEEKMATVTEWDHGWWDKAFVDEFNQSIDDKVTITCTPNGDYHGWWYQKFLDERKQGTNVRPEHVKENSMNLYDIAAIRVEYEDDDGVTVPAKVAVGPKTVLAPNKEIAGIMLTRELKEEDAKDLTLIELKIRAWN